MACQVGRLEILDAHLHIIGVVIVAGWKGCETVYGRDTGWLHLYPTCMCIDCELLEHPNIILGDAHEA
jgi:hypothetical protein